MNVRVAGSLLVTLGLLLGALFVASGNEADAAQECPEGTVLGENGVSCELDVGQNDVDDGSDICPSGQVLDEAGLFCEPIDDGSDDNICAEGEELDELGLFCQPIDDGAGDGVCPAGQVLDEAGLFCVDDGVVEPKTCGAGFELGADGETCIAIGPECGVGEIADTDGSCIKTFLCSNGLILASDLLSCISGPCPAGELLAADGARCIAKASDCPDGSPRPVGGSCLVVETIEGPDGPEVVVRCDASDLYCQAQVKRCAEDRARGNGASDQECEDPRASCDSSDETCAEANDRLVECAVRGDDDADGSDGNGVRIGGVDDPCADLCPALHRLDASGECVEFLDPKHPCVSFGRVPSGITTNAELNGYSYLAGTGQCVTKSEFLRRLGNFEAAAGAEADALTLLRETTSAYLTVEGQLAELEQQLLVAERAVRQFTEAAAEADAERTRSIKMLAGTRKQLTRERRILQVEAVDVYVVGDNDAAVESVILRSSNLSDIGIAQSYAGALLTEQVANLDRIAVLERDAETLADIAEYAVIDTESNLESAVEAAANIDGLLERAQVLRADQVARRDEEAALVAQLREDKAVHAQQLGIFEQASREIADILDESEFRANLFNEFDGILANPVIPAEVSSGFGPRLHPILGYVRLHNGVDMDADFGDPIFASADGVVQIAAEFGGYGNTVVLDHGEILTLYAHQSVVAVEAGDEVKRGDIIGFIGSTGLSTGPHLHFEVWVDTRTAVDPLPYLTDLN